tara:strand:- start:33649 stop:33834 length:186 start_codon:yes stop_codon:yes gene_type:complete
MCIVTDGGKSKRDTAKFIFSFVLVIHHENVDRAGTVTMPMLGDHTLVRNDRKYCQQRVKVS